MSSAVIYSHAHVCAQIMKDKMISVEAGKRQHGYHLFRQRVTLKVPRGNEAASLDGGWQGNLLH